MTTKIKMKPYGTGCPTEPGTYVYHSIMNYEIVEIAEHDGELHAVR
jgi:hypothetical protein